MPRSLVELRDISIVLLECAARLIVFFVFNCRALTYALGEGFILCMSMLTN